MLGILALLLVKDHQQTKDQLKSFDKLYLHFTGTFAWNCCLVAYHAQRLPTKLDKCQYFRSVKFQFGQGKVREFYFL